MGLSIIERVQPKCFNCMKMGHMMDYTMPNKEEDEGMRKEYPHLLMGDLGFSSS